MSKTEEVGWLIVHTENQPTITYSISEGDNFFGRAEEGYLVDIPIKGDFYVSRCHANLKVTKKIDKNYELVLFDNGERRDNSPSTNGTYLNGERKRLDKKSFSKIVHDDTIQVGQTKLVFKSKFHSPNYNFEEARKEVKESNYTATIIIP